MAFLDFYKLDLTHLIIIAFSSFVFYMLLNKLDREEKYKKLCFGIACFSGLIISIIVSYYTLETDMPLTSNYFE
jgi:multisubunit Na+/H+ antiporter MnhB subunit